MNFSHISCYDEYDSELDYMNEDVFDMVTKISTTPQCSLLEWEAFNRYMDALGYMPVNCYVANFTPGSIYLWDEDTLEYYFGYEFH